MQREVLISRVRRVILTVVFCVLALKVLPPGDLQGQEKPAGAAAKAAAEKDRFKIPEGDAAAIRKFMKNYAKELDNMAPEGETEEEQLAFSAKAVSTLVKAADRLLAAKPSEEHQVEAYGYKFEALQALIGMGQEDARKQLEDTMADARNHSHEEIMAAGWQMFLSDRASRWPELDAETKQAFREEILKKIDAEGPQPIDVSILNVAALQLERFDEEYVVQLLQDALPKLKSDDEAVQAAVKEGNFKGMLRRLTLLGKPMEISGDLLGGGKVDWDSYRGKVVLVDFWATWCGPCHAEVPNILEMYRAYHNKGFEVLGVSLDDTPKAANKYVKDMELPWDSIFPKNEDERGFDHPLARYYGINGIPTAILVDQEGRVVHMNARAHLLQKQLQKLLGEPWESPEDKAADKTDAEAEAAAEKEKDGEAS